MIILVVNNGFQQQLNNQCEALLHLVKGVQEFYKSTNDKNKSFIETMDKESTIVINSSGKEVVNLINHEEVMKSIGANFAES